MPLQPGPALAVIVKETTSNRWDAHGAKMVMVASIAQTAMMMMTMMMMMITIIVIIIIIIILIIIMPMVVMLMMIIFTPSKEFYCFLKKMNTRRWIWEPKGEATGQTLLDRSSVFPWGK